MEEFDVDAMRKAVEQNRKILGMPPQDNRIYRTKRTVSEEYGDIRQALDMWLDRANLPERAEWEIKDVQSALDKLAEFIPSRDKDNA